VLGAGALAKWLSDEIIPAIDLTNAHKVLQVGGASPALISELAKHYKNFNGAIYTKTLFRQAAEKCINECQLGDRIKVLTGNFVDNVPEGFDTIVMTCVASE